MRITTGKGGGTIAGILATLLFATFAVASWAQVAECGNSVCEAGESCTNCPDDCISGVDDGAICGNGVCEAGDGEDCLSCAADCAGMQKRKPANRFCCGDGDGQNPVSCGDSRCTTAGFSCTAISNPGGPYCCGDATCEGLEDSFNCAIDCGAPPCGDGFCDPATEDACSCAFDCGSPPASEIPNSTCQDGINNDCSDGTDCEDADCTTDPACACGLRGDACASNVDCCSGHCKGNGVCR